jgi:hypothetical protein
MEAQLIKEFAAEGLKLTFDAERPVATCIRETKRARMGYKVEFCYRFKSAERMYQYCEGYLAGIEEAAARKEERKAARAAERKEAQENVKKGDIFVASWGWEQTNVDAYQVVEKKGATVTLREIGLDTIYGSEGFMSDRVRPVKNLFIGPAFTKRITGRGINISDCQRATPAEEGKEFYRSWYA